MVFDTQFLFQQKIEIKELYFNFWSNSNLSLIDFSQTYYNNLSSLNTENQGPEGFWISDLSD